MKLVIVEDETITRNSLLNQLDWSSLGIDTVYTADNGLAGYILAKKIRPEIVITDIKMPKMDGLLMAEKILNLNPRCKFIVLSAYTNKSNLLHAIMIKPILVMDKPIDINKLQIAVRDAVKEANEQRNSMCNRKAIVRHSFARLLYNQRNSNMRFLCKEYFENLGWSSFYDRNPYGKAFLITTKENNDLVDASILDKIERELTRLEESWDIKYICDYVSSNKLFIYIFSLKPLSTDATGFICKNIEKHIHDKCQYYIITGKSQGSDGDNAASISTVKRLNESAFFYEHNQVLMYENITNTHHTLKTHIDLTKIKFDILISLTDENLTAILNTQIILFRQIIENHHMFSAGEIRTLYYEIISQVHHFAGTHNICLFNQNIQEFPAISPCWVDIADNMNVYELDSYLGSHIQALFKAIRDSSDEDIKSMSIKEYIHRNYKDINLSVKSIGDYFNLSTSYVCVIFKQETNETLNQYITNYRMQKAKQLLRESQYSVTEIGIKVGYRDVSYFGKVFRKHIGVTPVEYRNQLFKVIKHQ